MTDRPIRIGTRGSDLALWQANLVKSRLAAPSELVIVKTTGDRLLTVPLQGRLEKGFFTSELEGRLRSGEIDIAVHSLKDLPTDIAEGLAVGAYLTRAAAADLLVVDKNWTATGRPVPLKEGCAVGAASLRRQALLRLYSPSSRPELLRGNVPTRIRKLSEGRFGAVILARAGVERLGLDLTPFDVFEFDPRIWLPAPGQGVIAIECRTHDMRVLETLHPLDDASAHGAACIERKLLANFEGGCHTAFGAYARIEDGSWSVTFGIDDERGAWRQAMLAGEENDCTSMGAAQLWDIAPLVPTGSEELCRPVRL